jgi:hypothetical protein
MSGFYLKKVILEDIVEYMDDQEIINQVRKALEPYDQSWDEWLNSDVCFLNSTEIKVVGYVLAFQDIEKSAHLLNISRDKLLQLLDHVVKKLENQHFQYVEWVSRRVLSSN